MTNLHTFQTIKHAYRLRCVAEDSCWVYLYDIGTQGQLCPKPRIVFFGTSRKQAETWLARQEPQAFILPEYI